MNYHLFDTFIRIDHVYGELIYADYDEIIELTSDAYGICIRGLESSVDGHNNERIAIIADGEGYFYNFIFSEFSYASDSKEEPDPKGKLKAKLDLAVTVWRYRDYITRDGIYTKVN